MRFFFSLIILFPTLLFSQEARINILHEEDINDSLQKQTLLLTVYNNMGNPICLRTSTTFRNHLLSKDTIELARLRLGDRTYYDLWTSQEDVIDGYNDNPRYPLILYPRSAFVATISVLCDKREKKRCISFMYLRNSKINYPELLKKYESHQVWDTDQTSNYKTAEVCW